MVECKYCGNETGHNSNHAACDAEYADRRGALFTCVWCGNQLYEHQAKAELEEHPECTKGQEFTNFPGHD